MKYDVCIEYNLSMGLPAVVADVDEPAPPPPLLVGLLAAINSVS